MIKQFQTKSQYITMFVVLLALVIVIAQKVSAGTLSTSKGSVVQCDEDASVEISSTPWAVSDLPWSPFIAFLTR